MASTLPRPRPRGPAWRARAAEVATSVRDRVRWYGPGRIGAGIVGIASFVGVVWWSLTPPAVPDPPGPSPDSQVAAGTTASSVPPFVLVGASTTVDTIVVHVAGAVRAPGVVRLGPGARVDDAVRAAGGPTADADPDGVNLAAPLADGDRVRVPRLGEVAPGPAEPTGGAPTGIDGARGPNGSSVVDVNRSDVTALTMLPGIGPVTAAAIVEERDRNGPFRDVDDLRRVRGIGPAKVESLREMVRT